MKEGAFMISYRAKKSLLYKEFDSDNRIKYFDYKNRSFLHNIDTLYYVVKLDCDWRNDVEALCFREVLYDFQQIALNESDVLEVFTEEHKNEYGLDMETDQWTMNGVAASKIYRLDLQQADKFAVFIAASTPNEYTPEIIVQLRSQYLWLLGDRQAVLESYKQLQSLLSAFGLKVKEVRENRIDYAYHTNYIQDPTNYFKHQNINKMQHSRFSRGSIEFSFRNQFEVETDYLTLGRKKSNNLFFRIYDKTKEVIQQGYKQFFIELWHEQGLISTFDKFCIERAFLNPSAHNYKYLDVARLEFYLEHGIDPEHKKEIEYLLSQKSKDYDAIIELADLLTPPVTKILNVEMETKRKFYSTLDRAIDTVLQVTSQDVPTQLLRMFRILDNKKAFHDFITRKTSDGSGVIRFIDYRAKNRQGNPWKHKRDFPTSDFWQRLQNVAMDWHSSDIKLVREYQKNLSVHLLQKRIVNQLSTFSLYMNSEVKHDVYQDALDFISTLNETDLQKANEYKEKKYLLLKDRLQESEASLDKANDFRLVNTQTGEFKATDTQSVDTVDYNTTPEIHTDEFVISSPDDVLQSLINDYKKEIARLTNMLKRDITKNQRLILQRKLDKVKEKLSSL